MSTRHPLLPLLLTAGCLSCGQDGPTPLENRAPLFSAVHPSGASLIVDDDGAQCSDAQFTSIQAAVDAAAPGDRILVCTGTYLEQVTVSTNDVRIHAQNKAGPYGRGRRASVVVDAHGHDFGYLAVDLRSEAGSGATFAGNHCRTSSPSGLCERSRPSTSP